MATLPHPILIVEDDDDLRDAAAELLSSAGYSVRGAADGAKALALLRGGFRPVVILLDLMMPVMSGWAFREHQLADRALAGIPVVVLSAIVGAERARLPGVAAVLGKPLDVDTLLDVLRAQCPPG